MVLNSGAIVQHGLWLPVSVMAALTLPPLQRREYYCSYLPPTCSGHDSVDFSLCFEDTTILLSVCLFFWLMAGLKFLFGNNLKPPVRMNWLHVTKGVRW